MEDGKVSFRAESSAKELFQLRIKKGKKRNAKIHIQAVAVGLESGAMNGKQQLIQGKVDGEVYFALVVITHQTEKVRRVCFGDKTRSLTLGMFGLSTWESFK